MSSEIKSKSKTNSIIVWTITGVFICLLIVACIAVFCLGLDISNGNWTQLVGAFIGFLGSAILAMISYRQSEKVRSDSIDRENNIRRDSKDEMELRLIRETQPIIVIKKIGNAQNNYFDCKLCNYGKYPILNVVVLGHFYDDVVMPMESNTDDHIPRIRFMTGNNVPGGGDKRFNIEGIDLDNTKNLPQHIAIEYEDIYGNLFIQTFILDEDGRYRVEMQNGNRAIMKKVTI